MLLNLVVLRARDPVALAEFYALLGLKFSPEKHGNGPEHMACDTGAGVLEIYPRSEHAGSTSAVRLGFSIDQLDARCRAIPATRGQLLREPHPTRWGRRATILDPEGHTVDLVESESRADCPGSNAPDITSPRHPSRQAVPSA